MVSSSFLACCFLKNVSDMMAHFKDCYLFMTGHDKNNCDIYIVILHGNRLTLLFLLHCENGDFSILMKDIYMGTGST
jgi:hypothetical protein